MAQVGHAKPDTLLRIYAQVMQRDPAKVGPALDALMAGAALPAEMAIGPIKDVHFQLLCQAAEGTRTLDLLHGKQYCSRALRGRISLQVALIRGG
jgi:hypothetical protein